MEQKKFMDISRIKEDTGLTENNTGGFHEGDHIVIQEKMDGSNAAIAYDKNSNGLIAFSRKRELSYDNTLNGFWNWVQSLDVASFSKYSNYVFFGEWLVPHTIKYVQDAYKKFYFYDVYDRAKECYLSQKEVKTLSDELGLIYVNTFYDGPFISWSHCKSFVGKSDLALDCGEGVVIKNQTELNNRDSKLPFVLKIVTDKFSEIKKENHRQKVKDPQKIAAREKAQEIVDQIVTKNRVQKELYKMRDEGIIPEKINSEDMGLIAKTLPKRIFDDCIKEEKESVIACGEFFGKLCGSTTMKLARSIIFE